MRLQKIIAWFDGLVSDIFGFSWSRMGNFESLSDAYYFSGFGPRLGIVGADGKIHTIMGYWTVKHSYDGEKLLKRILLRKSLQKGERFATQIEIQSHFEERRRQWNEGGGFCISG